MNREILFCGDTHGRLAHVVEAALDLAPLAVVLLGDIESPRPLHVELEAIRDIVYWLHGNHDTDRQSSWSQHVDSELADRQLDGRVVTLADGTRLAGVGGVFRQEIWYPCFVTFTRLWVVRSAGKAATAAQTELRDGQRDVVPDRTVPACRPDGGTLAEEVVAHTRLDLEHLDHLLATSGVQIPATLPGGSQRRGIYLGLLKRVPRVEGLPVQVEPVREALGSAAVWKQVSKC